VTSFRPIIGREDDKVCVVIRATPFMVVVAHLHLTAEQAIDVAGALVEVATEIDPTHEPPDTRYRIRVKTIAPGGLWAYTCPAHPDEGIGLFHDQADALAAVDRHLAQHHRH